VQLRWPSGQNLSSPPRTSSTATCAAPPAPRRRSSSCLVCRWTTTTCACWLPVLPQSHGYYAAQACSVLHGMCLHRLPVRPPRIPLLRHRDPVGVHVAPRDLRRADVPVPTRVHSGSTGCAGARRRRHTALKGFKHGCLSWPTDSMLI
jgi:hypothetical protein